MAAIEGSDDSWQKPASVNRRALIGTAAAVGSSVMVPVPGTRQTEPAPAAPPHWGRFLGCDARHGWAARLPAYSAHINGAHVAH